MLETSELVLNIGPQHPSTRGELRVVLRLDGENRPVDIHRMFRMSHLRVQAGYPHPRLDVVRVRRGQRLKLLQGGSIVPGFCHPFRFCPLIRPLGRAEQGQTQNGS